MKRRNNNVTNDKITSICLPTFMVSRVERSLFYFAIVNVGGFTYLWERLVNVCNLFKTKNLFIGRCNKMALNSLTLFSSTDELMHGQRGGGGKKLLTAANELEITRRDVINRPGGFPSVRSSIESFFGESWLRIVSLWPWRISGWPLGSLDQSKKWSNLSVEIFHLPALIGGVRLFRHICSFDLEKRYS